SAVALATALLTGLLSIGRTAETRVLGELSKGGPLAGISVAAAAPDPSGVDSDNPQPGPPRELGPDAVRRIAALPEVRAVVPILDARVLVIVPDRLRLADGTTVVPRLRGGVGPQGAMVETLVGTDLRHAGQLPLTVLAGRLPDAASPAEVAVTPGHLARLGLRKSDAKR